MPLSSSDRRKQILFKLMDDDAVPKEVFSKILTVSEKTIQRDITTLRDWRWPIESGPNGYYLRQPSIAEKNTCPDMFLAINLLTNSIIDQNIPPLQPELSRQLKRNYLKVNEIDEPSITSFEEALDLGTNQLNDSLLGIIGKLSKAILVRQPVSFFYTPLMKDKGLERCVFPIQLRERHSQWYLCGYDFDYQAMRVFALKRTSDVSYLSTAQEIPSIAQIQEFLNDDNFGIWMDSSSQETIEVKIRFIATAARLIQEREYHSSQKLEIVSKDEVIATFQVSELKGIKLWLRSFISESTVLSPDSLREEMIADLETSLAFYKQSS